MSTATVPAPLEGLTLELLERALFGRSLRDYARAAWSWVDPDPIVWTWHMDAVCEHLEAVSSGQIEKLVVNIPPGCSKSMLVSVMWQSWEWRGRPEGRWFHASYDQELSTRDSIKCRNLIQSPWYQARWGDVFRLTGDENRKTFFSNDQKGWRLATSVGGHGTGEHPDRAVYDDLLSAQQAESPAERQGVINWLDGTMSTRGAARGVRQVLIMQRLHEEDPTAHLLKQGGWEHVCLPMRYEPGRMRTTVIGWNDPRTEKGALLVPERYPDPKLAEIERRLGPYGTAGQMQQRPSPATGGVFQRSWWRFWVPRQIPGKEYSPLPPVRDKEGHEYISREVPAEFEEQIQSWDCNFKDVMQVTRQGRPPDPVAGGLWARDGADCYLLDLVNAPMGVEETASAILAMATRYPKAITKLIEDKANGPAIMQILRRNVPGLTPVTPLGNKMQRAVTAGATERDRDARALSAVALVHAGNVYLPHPALCPQVWEYIEQHANFPNATHDDMVDMTSQALPRIQRKIYREADRDERAHRALGLKEPITSTQQLFDLKTLELLEKSARRPKGHGTRGLAPWQRRR